jgi:glyoxylase-like metal-dependent hydrolase (beta-lactamase superfamily II)
MQLLQLAENTWVLQGGANIGILAQDGRCLIIDSGMDKDAGRDILNAVKKLALTPTALLVTHAHADHFGGAHHLVRQTGLKVYATRIEAAVMAGPILEPLYLFGGAYPPRDLQHKFLLAKPCIADTILTGNETMIEHIPLHVHALPGHSIEQVGVAFGDTFFVGDAFLTPDILDKHRIPFYTDVHMGLITLHMMKTRTLTFKHIVAGHGEIYTSAEMVQQAIGYMIERLEAILATLRNALENGTPRPASDLLRVVADVQGLNVQTLSSYVLCQTTVQSALSTLYTQGEIYPVFQQNQLLWTRKQAE